MKIDGLKKKLWLFTLIIIAFSSLPLTYADESDVSSQTTSSNVESSSPSNSNSDQSNQVSESLASSASADESSTASQASLEASSSEEFSSSEPADTTNNEQAANQVSTMDDPPSNVRWVGTLQALKDAVDDGSVDYIYLTDDISLGNASLPVNHNITIDGSNGDDDNFTITYGWSTSRFAGIHFNKSDITIHYKNLNFGKESALGRNDRTNAGNYFGIAPPGSASNNNETLIIENVNYYSDYGAQPFYVNGAYDLILFRGNNEFYMQGSDITSGEFAEAANLTFEEGSSTVIRDDNMLTGLTEFIWAHYAPLKFKVEANALVDITTHRDIFWIDYSAGKGENEIDIAPGGSLKIIQSDTLASGSSTARLGRFITQDDVNFTINVGDGAEFTTKTKNSSSFRNLTMNLAENSATNLQSTTGTFFGSGTGVFNLNNASRLIFAGGQAGPIQGNATINFSPFESETHGYGAYVDGNNNQSQLLLTETDNSHSPWVVSGGAFSRSGTDFTNDEKTSLASTKRLAIERDTAVSLSWSPTDLIKAKEENLAPGDFGDKFYYSDPDGDDQLIFKIYDGNNNQISTDLGEVVSAGDDSYHEVDYYISSADMPEGTNNFTIKVFRREDDNSEALKDTLTLTAVVTAPKLELTYVSENLSWTNRTLSQTKGSLSRDAGNTFEVRVTDTRPTPQNWVLTANVTGIAPFSLVWKKDSQSTPVSLSGRELLRTSDVSKDENDTYTKTWDESTGVLLRSTSYLPIGDYSGQLTIQWSLYNVGANY
ncbi:hypothetical protein OZX68_05625 [Streptococcaceae bacterium ESL0729]|nr:hypothetical protein OZX68_05625 [Streptococcaceae bacterium ESL0729]